MGWMHLYRIKAKAREVHIENALRHKKSQSFISRNVLMYNVYVLSVRHQ